MKTVYYVEELSKDGYDCFEEGYTFDFKEAEENAIKAYNRLTYKEQKERRISVVGYEVEEIGTAKESLEEFLENAINYDPVYFENVTERIRKVNSIAIDAVDEFFEDYEEQIDEEGKDFINKMFGDKGPGSFDSIYLIGSYGEKNFNTELNIFFCDHYNVSFTDLCKAIMEPESNESLYNKYLAFYEKATDIAETDANKRV